MLMLCLCSSLVMFLMVFMCWLLKIWCMGYFLVGMVVVVVWLGIMWIRFFCVVLVISMLLWVKNWSWVRLCEFCVLGLFSEYSS